MFLPRALVLLKLLELRGLGRRLLKQMKRPAGALFVIIYILMFAPMMVNALFLRGSHVEGSQEAVLLGAPLVIGFLCVMSIIAPELKLALTFKPAEIDLLFAGPYSRRHIVTYKLLGSVLGALFMAVIMFLATFAFAPSRMPMFIGIYLAVLFSMLFNAVYTMIIQVLSQRVKYLGYAFAAGVLVALGYAAYGVVADLSGNFNGDVDKRIFESFTHHPFVRVLSAPFVPFAHVMAADGGVGYWSGWTALSVALIAGMYAIVVVLDADYMETAIVRSANQYAKLERFRRGQFVSDRAARRGRRWSLPDMPRLGGVGPVAWRQLTSMAHAWGVSIAALYAICIGGGLMARQLEIDDTVRDMALPAVFALIGYLSIIVPNVIRFDFRSDVDSMDGLKTLPLGASRLAAAQIVAPTVLIANIFFALGLGTAIAMSRPSIALAILAVCVPFAALMIGLENLLFLLWPIRMAFQTNLDIQYTGRMFVTLLVKFLVLGVGCGLAAAVAFACGAIFDSLPVAFAAASAILSVEAALTIPAIAVAFENFDPSTDTPP